MSSSEHQKSVDDSCEGNVESKEEAKVSSSIPIPRLQLGAVGGEDSAPGSSVNSPRDKKARNSSPGSSLLNSPRDRVQDAAAAYMVAASPPKYVVMEELMQAANGMANMALAHEISVNGDFKLEQKPTGLENLESRIKSAAERAFWDILQDRLNQDPPDYSMALQLLTDLKEQLLLILLPRQTATRQQIEEVLDQQLIQQQVEHGALDFNKYAEFVIDVMKRHCAPFRDSTVTELSSIQGTVPMFKRMFEVLELLRIDMANFHISQLRPVLQQQSVAYEKEKFAAFLNAQKQLGIDGLEATRQWLQRAKSRLCTAEGTGFVDDINKIMEFAYLELLDWDEDNAWPETLAVDLQRYMEVRYRAWHASLLASVLLLAVSSAGAALSAADEFKRTLKQHLSDILDGLSVRAVKEKMENVAEQVLKEVSEHLQAHEFRPLAPEAEGRLRAQIVDVYEAGHPVRKIMDKRLQTFFRSCLASTAASGRLQVPQGMTAVSQEVGRCAGQFLRLCRHNRSVFNAWYLDLLEENKSHEMNSQKPTVEASTVAAGED